MAIAIPGAGLVYRTLRVLPWVGRQTRARELTIGSQMATPMAESFRLLALNMRAMLRGAPHRGVVVMSASPRDGRSLVAANLAIALAEESKVLLIDGDRRGGLPLAELVPPSGGGLAAELPEILRGRAAATGQPRVWLMELRSLAVDSGEYIQKMIEAASRAGLFVIVDSPPAQLSSEAFALASNVGQVLYVVRRRVQDMEVHGEIKEHLDRLNARILGIVLNEA